VKDKYKNKNKKQKNIKIKINGFGGIYLFFNFGNVKVVFLINPKIEPHFCCCFICITMAQAEETTTTMQQATPLPRSSVSIETFNESNSFINILQETLEIVEDILNYLSDEEYLKICNNLLKLKKINDKNNGDKNQVINNLLNRVNNNNVVQQHRMRTQMTIRKKNGYDSDLAKLKAKDKKTGRKKYERCNVCDSILLATGIERHIGNDKCQRIAKSKSICVDFQKKQIDNEFKLIDQINLLKQKRNQAEEIEEEADA